jgi:hypothetical protein
MTISPFVSLDSEMELCIVLDSKESPEVSANLVMMGHFSTEIAFQ